MTTQDQIDELLVSVLRRGTFSGSFAKAYMPVAVSGIYASLELTEQRHVGQLMTAAYRGDFLQKIKQYNPKASITEKGWDRLYLIQQDAYKAMEDENRPAFKKIITDPKRRDLYEEIIRRHMPINGLGESTMVAPIPAHETVATAPIADMTDEQREALFSRRAQDGSQVHLAVQSLARLWSNQKGIDAAAITEYLEPVEIIRADYQTMFQGPDVYALRELKSRMSTAGEYAPTTLADLGPTRSIGRISPPDMNPQLALYAAGMRQFNERTAKGKITEGVSLSDFGHIARKAGYPTDMTLGEIWEDMSAKAKAAGISAHETDPHPDDLQHYWVPDGERPGPDGLWAVFLGAKRTEHAFDDRTAAVAKARELNIAEKRGVYSEGRRMEIRSKIGEVGYDGFSMYVVRQVGTFEGRDLVVVFRVPGDYDEDDVENFKAWTEKVSTRLFSKDDWGATIGELPTVDFIDARMKEEAIGDTRMITLDKAALVAREACFRVLAEERRGYTYSLSGGDREPVVDPVEFSRYMLGETASAKRSWWALVKFIGSIFLGSGIAAAIFGAMAKYAGVW